MIRKYDTDEERKAAAREAVKRYKKRNKEERSQKGGEDNYSRAKTNRVSQSKWWAALKKKHAGKPRLEKTEKPWTPLKYWEAKKDDNDV